MRRRCVLVFCIGLLVAACAGGCSDPTTPNEVVPRGHFSLEKARKFRDFDLYALGESYGEFELTAVQRQFDRSPDAPPVRANYVDFIYGTCEPGPGSEGRCSPPLSVQVWAACERNPMVYGSGIGQEAPIEVRGVPAYFYERGIRLELSTGTSTVVIFADGRKTARAAAAALRGVNNAVAPGEPLPEPAYTRAEGGVVSVIPCAYEDPEQQIDQDPAAANRVARALERELQAGAGRNDNLAVREVSCFRSPVPTRVGALSDAYQCQIGWRDGSFVTWCVLSGETDVLRETLPSDCETAAAGSESFIPAVDPGSDAAMRWGAHAAAACLPWRDKQTEAIAELDQDLLSQDLSYIWYVLRPTEAGLVRDLRVIPGRTGAARRAVAVYELRLALIDQGLREWQQGEKKRALEHWDRAEATKVALARAFDRVHAEACEPA